MTEEEAKTKWCPQYRIIIGTSGRAFSNRDNDISAKCIASDCMMWKGETDADGQELAWTGHCGLVC